jgi:hypothetical protein
MVCDECDGHGDYLDAPAHALDGRTYRQRCHVCGGTGIRPEAQLDEQRGPNATDAGSSPAGSTNLSESDGGACRE